MTRLLLAAVLVCAAAPAPGADPKPVKATVAFRGMATEEDAAAVRKAVEKVKGIKINVADIVPGAKGPFGHYFSPPVEIEFTDPEKTDLGHLGKVVAGLKTAERKDVPPPSLVLVLFTPELDVDSPRVRALRAAVMDVPGQEATQPGGLGGWKGERRYWIRIDATESAKLADLLAAIRKADIEVQLRKK